MCGGQQSVLSLESEFAYVEKHVTSIDFNRRGEVISTVKFDREIYEDALKSQIKEQLLSNTDKLFGNDFTMNREKATATANTLRQSGQILVSKEGDLYRIATVKHPKFTDEVAINPYRDNNNDGVSDSDNLNMGIFVVKQKEKEENVNLSKLDKREKSLKIILFLCT